jgi:hypothetical protein
MLRFHIRPTNRDFPVADILAHDAAAVLHIIEQMNCKEADVFKNGTYAFTVSLDKAIWTISRHGEEGASSGPAQRCG